MGTDGIVLTCTDTQMIVDIPKELLTGEMAGSNVRFENEDDADNPYCWGVDTTNDDSVDIIQLTTNLTECGTNRTVRTFFGVIPNVSVLLWFINYEISKIAIGILHSTVPSNLS